MPKYIVRWDDISPFIHQAKFNRLVGLFIKYKAKAVLGIIPDNRSNHVKFDSLTELEFTQRMQELEKLGWEMALHGDTHEKTSEDGGILGINAASEFAGLSLVKQEEKIAHALSILRQWGLSPRTFIAPWHSFDKNTLVALNDKGLSIVSDGFGLLPWQSGGLYHIPQIAWGPRKVPFGVLTICLHPNTMSERQFKDMEAFLSKHAGSLVTCQEYAESHPLPPRYAGAVNWFVDRLMRKLLAGRPKP